VSINTELSSLVKFLRSLIYIDSTSDLTSIMSYSKRIDQIAGHLNYPKGMLAGQTAIITGSGQGIGAEAAKLFAKEGAKVVVADVDASGLMQVS
jgi:S-adenosylhomocysteine hydrolase